MINIYMKNLGLGILTSTLLSGTALASEGGPVSDVRSFFADVMSTAGNLLGEGTQHAEISDAMRQMPYQNNEAVTTRVIYDEAGNAYVIEETQPSDAYMPANNNGEIVAVPAEESQSIYQNNSVAERPINPWEYQQPVVETQAQPQPLVQEDYVHPLHVPEGYSEPQQNTNYYRAEQPGYSNGDVVPMYNEGEAEAAPVQAVDLYEPKEELEANQQAYSSNPDVDYIPAVFPNFVEAGVNYYNVTNGQGDWFGQYARAEIQTGLYDRWSFDVLHQDAFDDNGFYGAIGNTHEWNEDWFTNLTVGASTGSDFYLPKYRVDGFLNRKWLPAKNFITTVGLGYYRAQDSHKDKSLFLGTTYYFDQPWIFQNGIRFNWSDPGNETSAQGFLALTYGSYGDQFITGRVDYGNEAYQIIGPGNAISDFKSKTASLTWRKWMDQDWGINLKGEVYDNPNYTRSGGQAGVFLEF